MSNDTPVRRRRYSQMDLKSAPAIPQELVANQYDRHQIQGLLDALPNNIYNAGVKVRQAEDHLDKLTEELKVCKAKHQLEASAKATPQTENLTAAEDRKAYVITQKDVQSLEGRIITAKGDMVIARLQEERLQNFFTSIRKHANLLISEDENTRAGVKWSKDERNTE